MRGTREVEETGVMDNTGLLSDASRDARDGEKPYEQLERVRRAEDWQAFLVSAGAVAAMLVFAIIVASIPSLRDSHLEKEVGKEWNMLISFCGWFAFAAWSISFYPQTVQNFVRGSVVGMNFDYQLYNLFGFGAYSFYNCAFFFNSAIQHMYEGHHSGAHSDVASNDVFFALHAEVLTVITMFQIYFYEKGDQRFTMFAIALVILLTAGLVIYAGIVGGNVASDWLELLTVVGWCKVGISLLKYMPQAYMNCVRGTTDGFNVYNVLLDFTGGSFNVAQQVIPCILTGSWDGIAGNSAKFGLGMASMVFDTIFAVQHYILFTRRNELYIFARSASGLMKPQDKEAVLGLMARDRMDDLRNSGLLAPYVQPGAGGALEGYGSSGGGGRGGADEGGEEGGMSPLGDETGLLLGRNSLGGESKLDDRLSANAGARSLGGGRASAGRPGVDTNSLGVGGTVEGLGSSLDSLESGSGRPFH